MSNTTCEICHDASYKYKCPSCKASSCSLLCFKKHEKECFSSKVELEVRHSETVPVSTLVSDEPLRNFIDQSELNLLFLTYPNLRSQLRHVFVSTLDPSRHNTNHEGRQETLENPSNAGGYRGGMEREHTWNPDRGFAKGLEALRSTMASQKQSSQGLREFSSLINGFDNSRGRPKAA